ncbi:MAG: energy transducer TonB [Burkholderiales bacterium]
MTHMTRIQSAMLGAVGLATAVAGAVSAQSQGPSDAPQAIRLAQAATTKTEAPSRPARPQEVRVRVLLLSDKLTQDNPEEYVEVDSVRYIHFKSPNLKSPARPLEDPRLRYPTGEFAQKNGAVLLQLLIDEQGGLMRTDVVCAAPPFEKSALESVQGLKFQPAVAREGPVKSYMLVEFGYGKGYPCARIPD